MTTALLILAALILLGGAIGIYLEIRERRFEQEEQELYATIDD